MLPELTTQNLILREVQLTDAEQLQKIQNRPEQWERQAVEPEDFADSTFRIQQYFNHRGEGDQLRLFVFVAELKATRDLVGHGSLSRSHPAIASLGFGVGRDHAGKGYATEISERLLRFGFEEIGLHRVEANVAVENPASKRVLTKIGMKYEGTIRESIWAQGRWWTEELYSKLAHDD
ncbi:GNAT family N-acetyltransferase [Zhengella mangrovi]|nr:GNAT family protein [Zhengella mangrovi]